MTDRTTALLELLNLSKPVDELVIELNEFPWDFDGVPVTLSRSHLLNVLLLFQRNDIDATELERWANAVECREDIEFEIDCADALSLMIYELANPVLEGKLSTSRCREMIDELSHRTSYR